MKEILELTCPFGGHITGNFVDSHARPILIRAREDEKSCLIFIEYDPAPFSYTYGNLTMKFYVIGSAMPYPNNSCRYFSSCLSPDGTALWHGLYQVSYAEKPSRVTQPEIPGPPGPTGPQGPAGLAGPAAPPGITIYPGTGTTPRATWASKNKGADPE